MNIMHYLVQLSVKSEAKFNFVNMYHSGKSKDVLDDYKYVKAV